MFTGDSSGSWLYEELHRFGWANQPTSVARGDGLRLRGAHVTAAARCAPPGNRPTPEELARCRPYLAEEIGLLSRVRVVLCLGRIAFDAYLAALADRGVALPRPRPTFAHAAVWRPGDPALPMVVTSYHPSRQNTQTGRLTPAMWRAVFARCRALVDAPREDR